MPLLHKGKPFIRSFTLTEILAVLVILAVLAAVSIASYTQVVENNANRTCQQNLKILHSAIVDVYAVEHPNDPLPTTLAKLEPRQIYLAYRKIVGEPKENRLIALFKNVFDIRPAFAQLTLSPQYYGFDRNVLVCPKDIGRLGPGQTSSYVINTQAFLYPIDLIRPIMEDNAFPDKYLIYERNTNHPPRGALAIASTHRIRNGIDQWGRLRYDMRDPPSTHPDIETTELSEKAGTTCVDLADTALSNFYSAPQPPPYPPPYKISDCVTIALASPAGFQEYGEPCIKLFKDYVNIMKTCHNFETSSGGVNFLESALLSVYYRTYCKQTEHVNQLQVVQPYPPIKANCF